MALVVASTMHAYSIPEEIKMDTLSAEITNLLTLKYINQSFTIMARNIYSVPW